MGGSRTASCYPVRVPERLSTISEASSVNEEGVDVSLIRYALRQTPTERLRALQAFIDTMRTVRRPPSTGSNVNGSRVNGPRDR